MKTPIANMILEEIYPGSVKTYLKKVILKLTHFAKHIDSKRYYKTLDGFLIGDIFANLGIETSLLEDAGSGYKIFGKVGKQRKSNAQEMRLLILYWLLDRDKGRKVDFIREVFE